MNLFLNNCEVHSYLFQFVYYGLNNIVHYLKMYNLLEYEYTIYTEFQYILMFSYHFQDPIIQCLFLLKLLH